MAAGILWYDLETFGLDSRYDRIAQFACIRTDENLEETGERLVLYCKPPFDYLPSIQSCIVHGITPRHAYEEGLDEYDFATRIRSLVLAPATTVAGFNSVQFDDEFLRFLLYRNLYDPYEREWKNGNSRWDIIDLARAARDLRPGGIVWPEDETGRPIFRLEVLAKANGIAHGAAHDALSDVEATIGLARLLRSRQPRLYEWHLSHRFRGAVRQLVDLVDRTALVHTAAEYTSSRGCTTLVAPVAMDPDNENQLVAVDLRSDPEPLVDLPVEEIRRRVFARPGEIDGPRVPLSRIRINRCPFLAPASTLAAADAKRLGIDTDACARRLAFISSRPDLLQKFVAVFEGPHPQPESADPDLLLYTGGFLPDDDRQKLERLHRDIALSGPVGAKEAAFRMRFEDPRPSRLIRRLYLRNFPQALSAPELERRKGFCAARLQLPPVEGAPGLSAFTAQLETKLAERSLPARDRSICHALLDWKLTLEKEALSF